MEHALNVIVLKAKTNRLYLKKNRSQCNYSGKTQYFEGSL